ncbi:double-strand break repair protein AddB [Aquibium carbonis]|uniref:Double-strand break repair protein AddB n=1 Tax=Aquibium carbonis TaxID=2495581 RepID=A0A3S0AW28_9HYPH|nr:double-strand break repair protein AddB [Aquibium carbonis]RST88444.1 double-strand break repair protein AddB [Aquibium carbonis]
MSAYAVPRVLSIPPGVSFLETLADALLAGRLVSGFSWDGDPLKLADVTIFVPTRRAARELRAVFAARVGGMAGATSAILPVIRPLGDFDEDAVLFEDGGAQALDLAPPIAPMERLMALAPLVQAWKRRLPAHVAQLFAEEVVVPSSLADAIWLARDLAALMDEIETEGVGWTGLQGLVKDDLANWWQVTLEFLSIVTTAWPQVLEAIDRSNPAAHRSAMIDAEAERLLRQPPRGPVIAAGSTGSIPATARLLAAIARLPSGAVVLPGLDRRLDAASWDLIGQSDQPASAFGHPQYGLKKLLATIGISRADVEDMAQPAPPLAARGLILSEALRPAETTEHWVEAKEAVDQSLADGALDDIALIEAANEREEAVAIAVALRNAIENDDSHVALVTSDRELARRVASELLRFGIHADDSGGTPLARTRPGLLLVQLLAAVFVPGDPVPLLALLKHPLFRLGRRRGPVRGAVEWIELVALRGGTGRPDIATLGLEFEQRVRVLAEEQRKPFWLKRLSDADLEVCRALIAYLGEAIAPLVALRGRPEAPMADLVAATVAALEAIGRDEDGGLGKLYEGDAGEGLIGFLRNLASAAGDLVVEPGEWEAIVSALLSGETVKPSAGSDPRVSIWGALEARLLSADLLVVGGLNEGTWPRKAEADRFMSRMMKTGIELEPPERRIGLAAHDFMMAMGAQRLVLTRAARAGDAPAVPSRWLQRLTTLVGEEASKAMRTRGERYLAWARQLDAAPDIPFVERPYPAPPVEARPTSFSVTEIETLRRDPYAVYARRILDLKPLDPLVRDPGAAERGTLFHDILHRFTVSGVDPSSDAALGALIDIARAAFDALALPVDVEAVWWPRFMAMAPHILAFERERGPGIRARHAEDRASPTPIGATGVTLSGYADRIDIRGGGLADILDYKTGSTPSKGQAHTLLSPQLALEGALLKRGAFAGAGKAEPADLLYVRLKPDGQVVPDSILEFKREIRLASDLSEEAWARLEKLVAHYQKPSTGYLSRALPFREGDTDGDYDHLARVLEWSAGADEAGGGEGEA